jgi:hypothetical protein
MDEVQIKFKLSRNDNNNIISIEQKWAKYLESRLHHHKAPWELVGNGIWTNGEIRCTVMH